MVNLKPLEKIRKKIVDSNLDAILITSPSNICYLTNYSNFSLEEREAYLFITKNFQTIITDGRYSEAIADKVPRFKLIERTNDYSIKQIFKDLSVNYNIRILGIEEENLTVGEFKILRKIFKKIKPLDIINLRTIKNKSEIELISKACLLGDKAFKFILKNIKINSTELEIAQNLENFIKSNLSDISFKPIVAFGANSSIPHHQTGNTKLKKGDFILLDFGIKLNNYCSDMTRTIFLGSPSKKQKEIYEIVLMAQRKAIEFIKKRLKKNKPFKAKEVDSVARRYIISQKFSDIPHSLGHGVGLQVHESPRLSPKSKDVLKEGMVFSIEPGIYIPKFGGVRIEDLFAIQNNKLIQLTNSPKNIIAI